LPADQPLSAEEVVEMKRHLRFLCEHRKLLGLRVNAAEDLLLNGAREPEHRGQCVHLLSKVDHASISRAQARLSDPRTRSRFLSGVVRFSTDTGVLLLFLESLSDAASRKAAAGAFSKAVTRLDFAEIGEARMRRVLELIASIFTDPYQRAQVLFGLLHSHSFRAAFSDVLGSLSGELAPTFESLSAVYDVIIDGRPIAGRDEALRQGVLLLIEAPEEQLVSYPEGIRIRLLKVAVELMDEVDEAERAVAALLESLPHSGDEYREFSLLRAQELLRQHIDVRARWQLRQLRTAQPACREAVELLTALEGPRMGRVALGWPDEKKRRDRGAQKNEASSLMKGFWLDHQCRVWLRRGAPSDQASFSEEEALSKGLVLGGLATVLAYGKGDGGEPFVVLSASDDRGERPLDKGARPRAEALSLALQGVEVLAGLHRSGLLLPDARRHRFLVTSGRSPRLRLADLGGLRRASSEECEEQLVLLAHRLCRDLLGEHEEALSAALRSFIQRGGVPAAQWVRALAVE